MNAALRIIAFTDLSSPLLRLSQGNSPTLQMWQEGVASRKSFVANATSSPRQRRMVQCAIFRWNSQRPCDYVSTSLEAIIETAHPKMAARAARSPSEAADLTAYILPLKQK